MGCRKSRTMYSIVSVENQELIRFENTWNAQKISFQELEAICRRSTTASHSKLLAQINSQFSLNIPPGLFEKTQLTHQEFVSFFILIGKGTSKDKNAALWFLFDTSLEENLDKAKFKTLLKTIIKASVNISLAFYKENHASPLISSWQQQLSERMESLEIKLLKHFLGENDSISFEIFQAKSQEMPLGLISSSSALRTQLEHTQVIPTRFANPFKSMKVTKLS